MKSLPEGLRRVMAMAESDDCIQVKIERWQEGPMGKPILVIRAGNTVLSDEPLKYTLELGFLDGACGTELDVRVDYLLNLMRHEPIRHQFETSNSYNTFVRILRECLKALGNYATGLDDPS